jgi:hypothetical protein
VFCRRRDVRVLYADGVRFEVHPAADPGAASAAPALRRLGHRYARQAWDPVIFEDPDLDFEVLFLIYRYPILSEHGSWGDAANRARRALRLASGAERAELAEGGRRFRGRLLRHFAAKGAVPAALLDADQL